MMAAIRCQMLGRWIRPRSHISGGRFLHMESTHLPGVFCLHEFRAYMLLTWTVDCMPQAGLWLVWVDGVHVHHVPSTDHIEYDPIS